MAATPASVNPITIPHARALRDDRDASLEAQSSREPYLSDELIADVHSPFKDQKLTDESIDDLVDRIILHGDQCIDSLPTMTAPELRMIGRAVSFAATKTVHGHKTRLYYTGLVSAVTATTVTLLHVNRYTKADFDLYKARERALSQTGPVKVEALLRGRDTVDAANGAEVPLHATGLVAHGYSTNGEVGVGVRGQLSSHDDGPALHRMSPAGSLAAATPFHGEVEMEAVAFHAEPATGAAAAAADAAVPPARATGRALHRTQLAALDSSLGPLPCVTFLRKHMLGVKFGRDPRSSFFSLFQDPSKELMDMQYLRMFVRRYLVHTSEGNNTDQVPLYAYVATRSGCPALNRSLVYHLVREELPELMKADSSIAKEKDRQLVRERRRPADPAAVLQPNVPTGIFAQTGLLWYTGIPRQSFVVGFIIAGVTVVAAAYLGASITLITDTLITKFLLKTLWFVVATLVVWALAAALTIAHAFFMRVPLRQSLVLLLARAALCVGGAGCSVMSIAVIVLRLSGNGLYNYLKTQSDTDLCDYYLANQCTGYSTSCTSWYGWFGDRTLCNIRCPLWDINDTPCSSMMWSPIRIALIPLIVFAALNLLICLYSLLLVVRVIRIARYVGIRRR